MTAEHVGGADKHWITKSTRGIKRRFLCEYAVAFGTVDAEGTQNRVKALSVFGGVYRIGAGSENRNSDFVYIFCKLYCGLSTEGDNSADRLLCCNDVGNVLSSKRLK